MFVILSEILPALSLWACCRLSRSSSSISPCWVACHWRGFSPWLQQDVVMWRGLYDSHAGAGCSPWKHWWNLCPLSLLYVSCTVCPLPHPVWRGVRMLLLSAGAFYEHTEILHITTKEEQTFTHANRFLYMNKQPLEWFIASPRPGSVINCFPKSTCNYEVLQMHLNGQRRRMHTVTLPHLNMFKWTVSLKLSTTASCKGSSLHIQKIHANTCSRWPFKNTHPHTVTCTHKKTFLLVNSY